LHVADLYPLTGILESGLVFDGYPGGRTFQTYESNIPFVLRFMIDKKMTGAAWLELPANAYDVVPNNAKVSHCQFELHAKYAFFLESHICKRRLGVKSHPAVRNRETDIISHAPEGVWSDIAPFRVLSFG
jgi:DNA polymerase delta subunit 1